MTKVYTIHIWCWLQLTCIWWYKRHIHIIVPVNSIILLLLLTHCVFTLCFSWWMRKSIHQHVHVVIVLWIVGTQVLLHQCTLYLPSFSFSLSHKITFIINSCYLSLFVYYRLRIPLRFRTDCTKTISSILHHTGTHLLSSLPSVQETSTTRRT